MQSTRRGPRDRAGSDRHAETGFAVGLQSKSDRRDQCDDFVSKKPDKPGNINPLTRQASLSIVRQLSNYKMI